MTYDERLQHVSVLGAAGKMGSGILLLTALEMADVSLKPENKSKVFSLNAIDVSNEALGGLMNYLRAQIGKMAEKKMVQLRQFYSDRADLIENSEIVDAYVNYTMSLVRPVTRLENAFDSYLIFEAIKEDPALKVNIFSTINKNNPNKPWFFTNTSSIPIGELDTKASLEGRIVGFHFYNPPAIQKLVELIKSQNTLPEIEAFALAYAKNLKKIVVPSHDVAGFIGNGHFMRDLLQGVKQAESLQAGKTFAESVYMVNKVTQEFLVRPMGIFQLVDYVGLDVCSYILSVMNANLQNEHLNSPVLDELIAMGVKGGQYSDGSQKDGFLKYEKGKIVAVFDKSTKNYIDIAMMQSSCDSEIGAGPASTPLWKNAVKAKDKDAVLAPYFQELKSMNTQGAALALDFAKNTRAIGQKLVADGVANNENDVNTVLLTGFFHAYGPINNY
ncbi:MAG: 3-hydroxyacyl-CoA dehydrogenase family protein [Bacteroidota bacterium]